MNKEDRYGWDGIVGHPGEYKMVPTRSLMVDYTYQRNKLNTNRLTKIASKWDWALCGTLLVANRNGVLYVIDGQQRLAAATKRSDIDALPCVIYKSEGVGWEANIFWRFNTISKKLKPRELYKAQLREGDLTAVHIDSFVKSIGYEISDGGAFNYIDFIATLYSYFTNEENVAKKALKICAEVSDKTRRIKKDMFTGMCYLVRHHIEVDDLGIRKLKQAGLDEIDRRITKHCILMGNRYPRACAMGILSIVNHGRRNRVRMPGEDEVIE
jgi:hypothetical protein